MDREVAMAKVWVTHAQFAYLQEAMLRAEVSGDPADVDHIISQLCIYALANGSDSFHPSCARVIPTHIEIID
jgi:hypothetical protein